MAREDESRVVNPPPHQVGRLVSGLALGSELHLLSWFHNHDALLMGLPVLS